MLLGIDDSYGTSYVGDQRLPPREVLHPIIPVAFFSAADSNISGPSDEIGSMSKRVFEEVSFDPVTNIRRGYVWALCGDSQPQPWHIYYNGGSLVRRLVTYSRVSIIGLFSGRLPSQILITFGAKEQFSFGEMMHFERQANGAEMITVLMRKQFSIVPMIKDNIESVSDNDMSRLIETLKKVEDGYRRSPPESVIDRCREACTVIFQCLLPDHKIGEDLSALIKRYEIRGRSNRTMIGDLAHAISRLHARPKASEHKRSLPPVHAKDAEMAVSMVGAILIALGWGDW